MRFTYDKIADAAYLKLGPGPSVEQDEVKPNIIFDYDANGRLIGIEVLGASAQLAPDTLSGAERLDRDVE
jgi:uncharacterized protein YuzE